MSDIWPAAFWAAVMMVRRMNVPSISDISAPRKDLKTCSARSTLVLYVTERSCLMS